MIRPTSPCRKTPHRDAAHKLAGRWGWRAAELGCWVFGIALILIYFVLSGSLESQRKQGIELFNQAQAHASRQIDDRPPDPSPSSDTTLPVPAATAGAGDADQLPIAVLRIERLGLEVPVYPDVSELNLSRGAGWIGGTAAPNMGGNMAIAAHRDQYFRPLKDIVEGDILELESLSAQGEYRVTRVSIVDPDDVSVLNDTPVATVTLVTCYPFYFIGNAPQRYIVQATAVE